MARDRKAPMAMPQKSLLARQRTSLPRWPPESRIVRELLPAA
jgi:hypothetical protein